MGSSKMEWEMGLGIGNPSPLLETAMKVTTKMIWSMGMESIAGLTALAIREIFKRILSTEEGV